MNSLLRFYRLLLNVFGDIHLERLKFSLFHAQKLRNVTACIVTAAEQTMFSGVQRSAFVIGEDGEVIWLQLHQDRNNNLLFFFELKEIGIVVSV